MVYLGLQDAIKFLTRNECTLSVRVMHYIFNTMFNSNQKTLWVDVILELPLNKNLTINKLKDDVSDHVTLFVQQSLFSPRCNSVCVIAC